MQAASSHRRRISLAKLGLALAFAVGLLLGAVHLVGAAPFGQSAEQGRAIFGQKCAGCHTIGGGRTVGPDLRGVTATRERQWLVAFIVAPDKLLAEKDPTAVQLLQEYNNIAMPNLGLTEAEAAAVLAYLESQAAQPAATSVPPDQAAQPMPAQPALPAGDPVAGQALFTGTIRLRNGGSPCIACHNVANAGSLGGGTLGPDLTQAFTKFGEAGLATVLQTLPYPTMQPTFANAPLTPEEQANLRAFFQTTATLQPVSSTRQIGLLAVAIFVALMAVVGLAGRGRLMGVRQPLVAKNRGRREAA